MVDLIKPMLAKPPAQPINDLGPTWIYDTKLDGVRVLAYVETGGNVTLINRNGVNVTHRFPEVVRDLETLPTPCVLDGEVVAKSGSFQDTARRDKQNKPHDVARHLKDYPVAYVAFDVLSIAGQDIQRYPWAERRQFLDSSVGALKPFQHLDTSVWSDDPTFYQQVVDLGMEGVIAKRKSSPYRAGRQHDWQKYKGKTSITCIGTGYDLGSGKAAHFGRMHLTMLDDQNRPVRVGVVGTGFTDKTRLELKAELDAGRPVVCEIEILNVTKEGALRHPSYKGLRTDVSVLDARLSQLDSVPRS
jgi:bifunctional non-homologous end joining protein LigD